MSRAARPEFVSYRDQLAAALRDAGGPVSARALGGAVTYVHAGPCREHGRHGHDPYGAVTAITCHGTFDVLAVGARPQPGDLAALERQGLCRKLPDPERPNGVLWEWTGPTVAVDELEAMLAL